MADGEGLVCAAVLLGDQGPAARSVLLPRQLKQLSPSPNAPPSFHHRGRAHAQNTLHRPDLAALPPTDLQPAHLFVSSACTTAGDTVQMSAVLELPPRLGCRMRVSLELRYGI